MFLMDGAGFGTWAAHVAVFRQVLNLSDGNLTLVLLCLIAGAIITMPIVGQLIGSYGSRKIVRIFAVAYFVAIAALGQTHSYHYLLPLAFVFGMTKGGFDVSVNAQVFAVEEVYKRSYQGLFQGSWSTGGLLGASAASLMLHAGGTIRRDLTSAAVVLGLGALFAFPALVSETPHATDGKKKFVRPDALLLKVAALACLGLMAEGAIADWASVYLHSQVHVTLSLAAIGYAAFSVTMALSRFSSDILVERFNSKQVLQVSGLCIALGMGCVLLLPYWWPAIFGFVLTGVGTATVVPVTFSIAGRDKKMGSGPAISAISTIGYFGFLAGPPLIGSLAIAAGLRNALAVIVLAGLLITIVPSLLSIDPDAE